MRPEAPHGPTHGHIRALGTPPTARTVIYGTLTAILPIDGESRRLTRTYAAFYTLVLAEPDLAREHGATYPDALEPAPEVGSRRAR